MSKKLNSSEAKTLKSTLANGFPFLKINCHSSTPEVDTSATFIRFFEVMESRGYSTSYQQEKFYRMIFHEDNSPTFARGVGGSWAKQLREESIDLWIEKENIDIEIMHEGKLVEFLQYLKITEEKIRRLLEVTKSRAAAKKIAGR